LPDPEDRLRSALERLAPPADPAGAYERIVEKKIRRQIYRKFQATALTIVVLAGTIGGTIGLVRVFRAGNQQVTSAGPLADNGLIAFVSARDGTPDIFVMRRDGTHVVNLTHDPADDHGPAFSPDGTKIAFVSDREGNADIFLMKADGTDVHRLVHLPGSDESPSWSPNGSKIAFADNTDIGGQQVNYQLYVMNGDGSDVTRLTSDQALVNDSRPAWSPNGDRIAVASEESFYPSTCPPQGLCHPLGSRQVILVASANGSEIDRLSGVPEQASDPAWSPKGDRIAFEAQGDLYVTTADGEVVHRVTRGPAIDAAPAWSPDGTKIVFSSDLDGSHGVDVVDVSGSGRRRLTSGVAEASAPSWQPLPKSHMPVESTASPSPSPSPSQEPSETPSPSSTPPPPAECATSFVNGDFDGDGLLDTASICPADKGGFSLDMVWGPGPFPAGSVALPDCQDVCEALAATDLDGDGADEFVLQTQQGASTQFVEVYELPSSEAFGQEAAIVADPGAPSYPAGEAAVFPIGGSVTHMDFLTCVEGSHEVVATSAKLNDNQTEWSIHETAFTLDPAYQSSGNGSSDGYGEFTVVSTADSVLAFDPTGENQPQPRGSACWEEGAAPSPTAVP
jgi:Tol biopolymer transport system component